MDTSFIDLFTAAIGIYMLISAISGKGKIYENQNLKEGCEEKYYKMMRTSLFILGPLCTIGGAINYFLDLPPFVFWIIWGITIAGFGILIVNTARLTDKNKKFAPPTEDGKPYRHPAFDFDDEDEGETPVEEPAMEESMAEESTEE